MNRRAAFEIGGIRVPAGTRRTLDLPVSLFSDHTPVTLSVHVVQGRRPGPTVFVSSAIHGDEVMGVEVVRRLLRAPQLDRLAGTLLVVPIVNTFGFLTRSRYLPDRRDLNRCFPGSATGSIGARLAQIFMTEIAGRADLGIDLHSAAVHRTNLPQIRVSPDSKAALAHARAFGAPVILTSGTREGSLRQAARAAGIDVLLYEAGEGLRFDELSARVGMAGILRVLREMAMVPRKGIAPARTAPILSESSRWLRAPAGGLLRLFRAEGEVAAEGDLLATVSDPFGEQEAEIRAPEAGIIVGRAVMPSSTRATPSAIWPGCARAPTRRRSTTWPGNCRPIRCLTRTRSSEVYR